MRRNLEQKQRSTGKTVKALLTDIHEPTGLPIWEVFDEAAVIWAIFADLHHARECTERPQPIGYGDVLAYCTLMDIRLMPSEVAIIRALDNAFMAEVAERMRIASQ